MKVLIVKDYEEMSRKAANIVASQIILKPDSVIGLATGDTPKGMYRELIKLYNNGDIDFANIKTFNLDEYYGLPKENPQSYHYYMMENLFKHVNIKKENIHIPNGMVENIEKECEEYEKKIQQAGGIDLQVLGIGRNGHIGFNEPDLKFEAKTHLVELDEDTIKANSRFFNSIEEVPTKAISMGIKTIMHAKKIVLLASGKEKAEAIYKAVKGEITPKVPASVLQLHPDVILIADEEAASLL
ncbi:glucosamine-6-phosphate deaminase [Caloranaerobacter azorensis H53214]|uniref:Glucosamine-6-phosphate deaminase n=3 Tax=Caloranaerobacter azorensis TaxID=116090 RepID=A0A096DJN7_9FIRM|nr:glucosamine-6-phosphate deaminase [Caloranaerobacter azorensis]KGG79491.1 glucosamine-6-phosphate deaminase [Caloranaerobacter azorensis H53214]